MSDSNIQGPQSMMTEVASRLRQTEQRAATVINALERQKSIQDSLDVAGKDLHEANSLIAEFARETKRATEEFVDTVSALRGAIDVLRQSDPAVVKSRLDEIDQHTRDIESGLKNLRDQMDAELVQLRDSINATADDIVERLTSRSSNEFKNFRNHIDDEQLQLRDAVKHTADDIIQRLESRSLWEVVFGKR